ncbi:MAG: dGTP triphosphohydrolase [Paraclostridium sp.]
MENKTEEIFKAQESKAKRWDENKDSRHPIRTEFQRDRDRILYSRAFRRLSGKTQVFTSKNDDHIRTRLTHTLEVSQIARTISKALGLDEDLTEAIALGHDLGHTPFGHVGERTLNQIMNGCYTIADFNKGISKAKGKRGFKHNLQGARVVNELEESPLNLTNETIWGIINHSSLVYKECDKDGILKCDVKHKNEFKGCCSENKYNLDFYDYILEKFSDNTSWTLEALVVGMADEIAQRHHDIEDAIEFKILTLDSLYKAIKNAFKNAIEDGASEEQKNLFEKLENIEDKYNAISKFSKFIVDFLTTDLITETRKNIETMKQQFEIKTKEDFYKKKKKIFEDIDTFKEEKNKNYVYNIVKFSSKVKEGDEKLQEFLKSRILKSFEAQRMDGLGNYVIIKLFEAYTHNPQQLSNKSIKILYKNIYENRENLQKTLEKLNIEELEKENKEKEQEKVDRYKRLLQQIDKLNPEGDVGEIRELISELHFQEIDRKFDIEKIYKEILLRTICDYIGGMTDSYAINEHKALYNHS